MTLYYHQMLRLVDRGGGDRFLERLYAAALGPALGSTRRRPGRPRWQNRDASRATRPFVVELPGGPLSRRGAARHAGAVLAVARAIAPPRERSRPIPFGADRRRQMRAYAAATTGSTTSGYAPAA